MAKEAMRALYQSIKAVKKPHKSRSGAGWGESETMYKSNKNTDKQTKLASFSEKRDKPSWG